MSRRACAETHAARCPMGSFLPRKFIWVFEISGGAPPAHFGGWKNTADLPSAEMYSLLAWDLLGVSKPGVITWARFYETFGNRNGLWHREGSAAATAEVNDRLKKTTSEWPIANVHIPEYERDQLMTSHMSNHITIG